MSDLEATLQALEAIAPIRLAADWDNVGLLIGGPNSIGEAPVGGLRVPRKRQGELLPP